MLTLPEVRRRVNAIVADKRDYVYQLNDDNGHTCVYFNKKDEPACLVGRALEPELRAAGINHESHLNKGHGIGSLRNEGKVELTPPAARWLAILQDAQDNLHPWGEAVSRANKRR